MANPIYSPVIKGKLNDLKALGKLSASARTKIKPMIEAMPLGKKIDVDKHLYSLANYLIKHAPLGDIFLDFYGIKAGLKTADGQDAVLAGFNLVKSMGRTVTPAYGFNRDDTLWQALGEVCLKFSQGFCFRVDIDDIDDVMLAEETWAHIIERSSEIKLKAKDIDVMIDLRDISNSDLDGVQDKIIDFLTINADYKNYRSIILVGSSALKTVKDIPVDGVKAILRNELVVWAKLLKDLPETINIVFGDYGIIHPDFSDQGPNKYKNAKIRYTNGWNITYFRGHGLTHPVKDYAQYHKLADKVRSSQGFSGREFSYGDAYIDDVADINVSHGSPATWVLADMNHHLEYTAVQMESLIVKIQEVENVSELIAIN